MMVRNIWNPTHNEIRTWAYTGTSLPHPHWAITLIDFNNLPVLIELAGDEQCFNQSFFEKCLYTFTGLIMEKHNLHELARLETTLEELSTYKQPKAIKEWVEFSQVILGKEDMSDPVWEMDWTARQVRESLMESEA
ncbi:flagellar biosynthesis regulator FlbT [Paenibacillus phyllosphaerae]|uniref:Flagellar biosynthesis regulator FlbT n=1 Tax=Paenibacillus phyllosphaerae TaxID=274593 RepID=A0A7W5FNE5_9BACL|nr:hypothetical protein [Paenibacillus phyllosphaerae]MBB3111251.1 flagellar biosynthesis regulator FlbT [Paenibacillus phyllosphaerae]